MASKYDGIIDTLGKLSSWSENNESVSYFFTVPQCALINGPSPLKTLLEPYTYITSNPGKEIRGAMIDAFNTWLNVPEDKLKIISRVVSMLHSASLLYVTTVWTVLQTEPTNIYFSVRVDDIEDDSQLRRGQPGMC
jgi:geranylgeranyl diphosphate synthase, type III